jgi:hypothetical protein
MKEKKMKKSESKLSSIPMSAHEWLLDDHKLANGI